MLPGTYIEPLPLNRISGWHVPKAAYASYLGSWVHAIVTSDGQPLSADFGHKTRIFVWILHAHFATQSVDLIVLKAIEQYSHDWSTQR